MATAAWEDALRLPQWDDAPVWLHGDLLPGSLLTSSGHLTAVIDFGAFGVGARVGTVLRAVGGALLRRTTTATSAGTG
ncbi:hypothetical protein ACM01_29555 [Streptomyces viridochromogenes]|uniref:Aminoglycoside phosphotransferase domain-containing protein n=1 Tax=Streptomyces viridochromogenes TaxID=1938 RepID=A0A0J7Z712_STRVR|nr:hypothetical protein ACM01_29555 [Streptomyces viridochromogenes]KOG07194.1 hypothetical protein ADK36_44785 [Streptomyces viridochromogenes]